MGKFRVPPPEEEIWLMADWIATVSNVIPSAVAPKSRTEIVVVMGSN